MASVKNLPIEVRTDESVLESHRMDSLNILIYLLLMVLTVVTVWIFKHRRFQYIHETGLAIVYGLIVGAIINYASPASELSHMRVLPEHSPATAVLPPPELNSSAVTAEPLTGGEVPPGNVWLELEVKKNQRKSENRTFVYTLRGQLVSADQRKDIQHKATFDPEIFFNIILPPIIFAAGYSMKRRHFFQNFGAIFTYAMLGTTISIFVVASICFAFTRLMSDLGFTFNDCLFFGAIISSTDPVTILAIFNDMRVDVTLHAIVFGESVLNDAVAIVFATSVQNYAYYSAGGDFDVKAFLRAFGNFFSAFFGSSAIGVALGCGTALLTKFTRLADFPLLETALFVLMSYSTFLIAEAAQLTGIVAVLFCGICQAHYTYNNLSKESQDHSKFFFELLSFLAENFTYCYIGVSLFTFPYHLWSMPFILVTILAVILGRVLNVYPLSALLNFGRKRKIPLNFQHVLFFSGLRGAISYSLAIRNVTSDARRAILTATSVIVIVTVIVAGGAAPRLLNFLHIPSNVQDDPSERRLSRSNSTTNPYGSLHGNPPTHRDRTWAARLWRSFDVSYVKPLLTHSRPSLMETCPDFCAPLARWLTSSRQFGQERWKEEAEDRTGIYRDDDDEETFNAAQLGETSVGMNEAGNPGTGKEVVSTQPKGPGSPFAGMTSPFDNRDLPV